MNVKTDVCSAASTAKNGTIFIPSPPLCEKSRKIDNWRGHFFMHCSNIIRGRWKLYMICHTGSAQLTSNWMMYSRSHIHKIFKILYLPLLEPFYFFPGTQPGSDGWRFIAGGECEQQPPPTPHTRTKQIFCSPSHTGALCVHYYGAMSAPDTFPGQICPSLYRRALSIDHLF